MTTHPKPWLSIQEAAEYLSCSDDSVERRLHDGPKWITGKLRMRRIDDWGGTRALPIRVLGEDVYALLPLPEGHNHLTDLEAV